MPFYSAIMFKTFNGFSSPRICVILKNQLLFQIVLNNFVFYTSLEEVYFSVHLPLDPQTVKGIISCGVALTEVAIGYFWRPNYSMGQYQNYYSQFYFEVVHC